MRYTIYTDGAYTPEKNCAGLSYLIITDDTYIASDAVQVATLTSATNAECTSIGLALAYMLSNIRLTEEDVVEVHSDCLSAITFFQNHLTNGEKYVRSNVKEVINSVITARKVSDKCTLRLIKVRGHKSVHTPNTVVDRLAKLAVRR